MGVLSAGRSRPIGPFAALLTAQILFMSLMPFADDSVFVAQLIRYGFIGVLIAGLGVARENRGFLGIAVVLMLANLVMQWLAGRITEEPIDDQILRGLLGVANLSFLILVLLRTLSRQSETTADVVLGGINVYLLLALTFSSLHQVIELAHPGSYVRAGLAISDPANLVHASLQTTLFYFSVTTLTTLGYGDIAPALPVAQFTCSAEAIIGQLYVAIFIGGLVALRVSALRTSPTTVEQQASGPGARDGDA